MPKVIPHGSPAAGFGPLLLLVLALVGALSCDDYLPEEPSDEPPAPLPPAALSLTVQTLANGPRVPARSASAGTPPSTPSGRPTARRARTATSISRPPMWTRCSPWHEASAGAS